MIQTAPTLKSILLEKQMVKQENGRSKYPKFHAFRITRKYTEIYSVFLQR